MHIYLGKITVTSCWLSENGQVAWPPRVEAFHRPNAHYYAVVCIQSVDTLPWCLHHVEPLLHRYEHRASPELFVACRAHANSPASTKYSNWSPRVKYVHGRWNNSKSCTAQDWDNKECRDRQFEGIQSFKTRIKLSGIPSFCLRHTGYWLITNLIHWLNQ